MAVLRCDILLFLHADALLPHHFDKRIRTALTSEALTLGAFHLKSDTDTRKVKWICWWATMCARLFPLPYGDQGLFIRRSDFIHLEMFPELESMEDFAFVRKIKLQQGKICILKDGVIICVSSQGFWRAGIGVRLDLYANSFSLYASPCWAWKRVN